MLRPGPNSAPTHLLAGFSVERERLRKRERKGQQGEKERRSRRGQREEWRGEGGYFVQLWFFLGKTLSCLTLLQLIPRSLGLLLYQPTTTNCKHLNSTAELRNKLDWWLSLDWVCTLYWRLLVRPVTDCYERPTERWLPAANYLETFSCLRTPHRQLHLSHNNCTQQLSNY